MKHGGDPSNREVRYRQCAFGHTIRVYPDDERVDIELCPICLKRMIRARWLMGEHVPTELIDVATMIERRR